MTLQPAEQYVAVGFPRQSPSVVQLTLALACARASVIASLARAARSAQVNPPSGMTSTPPSVPLGFAMSRQQRGES